MKSWDDYSKSRAQGKSTDMKIYKTPERAGSE